MEDHCSPGVETVEIMKIIKSFKNNKGRGLAAEHHKFSPDSASSYLADILNYILRTGYVPKQLKEGVLTPVLKRAKIVPSLLIIEELRSCPFWGNYWRK